MSKTKVIISFSKKVVKKLLRGDLNYNGRSSIVIPYITVRYGLKYGPKQTLRKIKFELVRIATGVSRLPGNNLAFSNGLVTGVEMQVIKSWYQHQHRHVTIVIPSYNDANVLAPCIESLKRTTNPKYVKIIIVDDYCQESSRTFLKSLEDEQVSVVYREENGGFAKAVNSGLAAADKRHDVILLNSDTVAHKNWLAALQYGAYEFGVDTGIVGPKLLYPDGRIQSAGSYRNTEAPEYFDHYYRFQDSNYGPANIPHYCLAVTGACMYIKREFMKNVGVLDDNFQFAFEDVDWCLRGWEAGYRSLYFPAAVLTHVESATRPKHKTISEREKQSISYFWNKWGDWFDKRNVRDKQGRVRIIFVLQTMGLSGGIKIVFEHAEKLAARGFNVEIWGLDHHGIPWDIPENVKIRSFRNYDRMSFALASEEAIKVATWWETAFPVWLASVKKGIPVYFIQEFETWFYPDDVTAQATVVSCYRKEFRNMTTSKYNHAEITSLGLKAAPIPCGYNDKVYRPLKGVKREGDVLLGVGRSFFQKNFRFTFKSWLGMGENRPKMWLFGSEPDMQKLDKRIKYFVKPSDQGVNELYNKATVFAQTSRHEGFSLPILEAMAAGCPVICTDAHGNRDFCFDKKNCLIVEHDDVEGMTKALQQLFDNPKLRAKLSAAGIKTAQNYRWKVIMDKVEAFYKEVSRQ